MSKNVIASIKKKLGGLEHGDECPKRISHSKVSDLVFKINSKFSTKRSNTAFLLTNVSKLQISDNMSCWS